MFKPLLRAGAMTALALLPGQAFAQAAPAATTAAATVDADPALWVVKDRDTTVYLLGTVHVLRPGLSWFDEAVKTAFDKSDQVVIEMITPPDAEVQAVILRTAVNAGGPTLTQRLPEDKRAAFAEAMTAAGLPPTAFDQFDPWFAASNLTLIPLMKLGYDLNSGVDKNIAKAARDAGKPVTGLETFEQQIGFFDGLSEAAQIAFLSETVKDLPEVGAIFDRMVDDWAKGDPDALARLINEGLRTSPEISKTLLTDRNIRWADWIATRMKTPGTVFIAVGAGHLAGGDSVQVQLRKRRIKPTRVEY